MIEMHDHACALFNGQANECRGLLTDIDEGKQAEQRLKEQ